MNSALFVANYIIEYCNEQGFEINNLRLQKLLYFVNVRNIIENGVPLFSETMEKWKFGPVVPRVYHEYKRFGAFKISKENIVKQLIEFDKNPFSQLFDGSIKEYNQSDVEDPQLIEDTVNKLQKYGSFDLVYLSHKHTPWKKEEYRIMKGIQGIEYSTEELQEYFNNNPEEKIWIQSQ